MKKNKKFTRKAYREYLNDLGISDEMDKKSNGGRIPDHVKYGNWLERNDPIAFNVGYRDEAMNREMTT